MARCFKRRYKKKKIEIIFEFESVSSLIAQYRPFLPDTLTY